jgi:hypothetical protein
MTVVHTYFNIIGGCFGHRSSVEIRRRETFLVPVGIRKSDIPVVAVK